LAPSSERPPFYIVGLPDEPIEASEAKTKFERLSGELCRVYPHIEEIRAVVKSKKASKDHARYEVSVEVYTPRERHAFSESGYNIAKVFDTMVPKMKRLLSSRQSRVTSTGGRTRRKSEE
jgi:ribosome-associated translation inhibitor RaiA